MTFEKVFLGIFGGLVLVPIGAIGGLLDDIFYLLIPLGIMYPLFAGIFYLMFLNETTKISGD